MEISHPRRILAVSRPGSGLLDLLKGLTGSSPSLASDTIAGTTHLWPLKTAYYTTTVSIWLDEITSPSSWAREFLAPEAKEVLTALGAFVICFRKPVNEAELKDVKDLLEKVGEVVKEGCGMTWDGVCLAVAMPQSVTPYLEKSFDEWEELCQESGFEFVDFESKGLNEYSEPMGIERLREALEANDWETNDLAEGLSLEDFDDDGDDNGEGEGSIGIGIEATEMEMEMFGMKQAIYGSGNGVESDDEEDQNESVEQLQAMMLRMQAVRDMGADMPEAERKRFAANAVNEIMKQL